MININTEFITLGQLLKMLDIANSGGEIKHLIKTLDIKVNGTIENRRGKKLYKGDIVIIDGKSYTIN